MWYIGPRGNQSVHVKGGNQGYGVKEMHGCIFPKQVVPPPSDTLLKYITLFYGVGNIKIA